MRHANGSPGVIGRAPRILHFALVTALTVGLFSSLVLFSASLFLEEFGIDVEVHPGWLGPWLSLTTYVYWPPFNYEETLDETLLGDDYLPEPRVLDLWGVELRIGVFPVNVTWHTSNGAYSGIAWRRFVTFSCFPWIPPLILGAYPAVAFARGPLRRYRRRRRNQCVTCGYSLVGNVSGACPECGRRIVPGSG